MVSFRPVCAGLVLSLAVSSWVYAGQASTPPPAGSATGQATTAKPADPTQKPPAIIKRQVVGEFKVSLK